MRPQEAVAPPSPVRSQVRENVTRYLSRDPLGIVGMFALEPANDIAYVARFEDGTYVVLWMGQALDALAVDKDYGPTLGLAVRVEERRYDLADSFGSQLLALWTYYPSLRDLHDGSRGYHIRPEKRR